MWQRGGAATGFSTWTHESGECVRAMVKLPVGPVEHTWSTALGMVPPQDWSSQWALTLPIPRVLASGKEIGGADLAWIVTERLEGPPLGHELGEAGAQELIRAVADFQAAAMRIAPLGSRPVPTAWEVTVERSKATAKDGGIEHAPRWLEMLKKVYKALPYLKGKWEARATNAWCHGDLHPGNAMRRGMPAELIQKRGCVLIDLALVHAGHWVEDALYLERQFWGHEEMLGGVKPVSLLAKLRRERGLPADDQYSELAAVRRVLTASCAPALMEREGNRKYLAAALGMIEKFLPQVAR